MSFLTACQSSALRLIGRKPNTFFSSQDTFEMEIVDLANEVAKVIADQHDWQVLTKVHTLTGDGVTTSFSLPSDYDRQLFDSRIYDATNWAWGYCRVVRADEWLALQIRDFATITPGFWTLLENQLQFLPAPPDTEEAKFMYIGNSIVRDENGNLKSSFTADSDTFVLDERLLTLGIIWRWREQKRLESAADQANYDALYSDIAGRDGGAKPIMTPSLRWQRGLNLRAAYPWNLSG